jgi:hypothetical protein
MRITGLLFLLRAVERTASLAYRDTAVVPLRERCTLLYTGARIVLERDMVRAVQNVLDTGNGLLRKGWACLLGRPNFKLFYCVSSVIDEAIPLI